MKALVLKEHGDLSALGVMEVPAPSVMQPTDVLVDIKAAALNHLDLWTVGGLPGLELKMPHILGGDGAGVVRACGAEVREVQAGDRVLINPGLSCYRCDACLAGEHSLCVQYKLLGEHVPGTLAEQVVVPVHNLARIPDVDPPVSWEEAAGFTLATLTAWRMVTTRAAVSAGETVFIWGIGGGVALAALQICKVLGARVIVSSSSDKKLDRARTLGADVGLNHSDVDVAREVYRLTERRGVDVVVDNVGEKTWAASTRMLGRKGRLVTCGGTTGPMVVTDVRRLFWNQHTIMGSTMGSDGEFRRIVQMMGRGQLRTVVDSVTPLEDAATAFARMKAGEQFGKVTVRI